MTLTMAFGTVACDETKTPAVIPTPDAGDRPDTSAGDAIVTSDGTSDVGPQGDMTEPGDVAVTPDGTPSDVVEALWPDPAASAQIAAVLAAEDGEVDLAVTGAIVTYIRPEVGNDYAGIFVQAETEGPALLVTIDGEALGLQVGDALSFTVTTKNGYNDVHYAEEVTDISVLGSGDAAALAQDVSEATDLVFAIGDYAAELVVVTATVTSEFAWAGTDHDSAQLATAGLPADENLIFRLPSDVLDALTVGLGCEITVGPTPMWRYWEKAQVMAWAAEDVSVQGCPSPHVLGASTSSATEVLVSFDRQIDPASVLSDGSQFTFNGDLTAVSATVEGTDVRVVTGEQVPAQVYDVTVDGAIADIYGGVLDMDTLTQSFEGWEDPAVVLINEINANIDGSCDLLELRVLQGGSMKGFQLRQRSEILANFEGLRVGTNDLVVVHANGGSDICNPTAATLETEAKDELAVADHPGTYAEAWDWFSDKSGFTGTDNVFTLYDGSGAIVDAVFVTDAADGTTAEGTEDQAAEVIEAGEWYPADGVEPEGGWIDEGFNANAVVGLKDTSEDAAGTTLQRGSDGDTNTMVDWGLGDATWGALNAGQTGE